MSVNKQAILQAVADFKAAQPPGWRNMVRKLLRDLDDPFREHVYRGSEGVGRHGQSGRISAPAFDDMDDESDP